MTNPARSKKMTSEESAEVATRNMVALVRKRGRGQRFLKVFISFVALGITAAIFATLYFHAFDPNFEWKWLN